MNKKVDQSRIIIFLGLIVQIAFFIWFLFYNNICCDEAMTVLNARSIADKGADVLGNSYPIYFGTWLYGGQSPIATYFIAVFIKLFGYSLFVSRLPMALTSVIAFFAFYKLLVELKMNNTKIAIIMSFAAFSPCRLFTSMWTLDCEFAKHFFIIGVLFLVMAINNTKKSLFLASMFFFSLCIYSYILSTIIVSLFLLFVYCFLLKSKKISLYEGVLSVLAFVVFSLPFFAFLAIQIGLIDGFAIGNISFNKMEYYLRQNDIIITSSFSSSYKCKLIFLGTLWKAVSLFVPDYSCFVSSPKALIGNFGHSIFGISILGFIVLSIKRFIKRIDEFNKIENELVLSNTFTFFLMSLFVYSGAQVSYRDSIFSYLFYLGAGLFIYELINKMAIFKKKNLLPGLVLACCFISVVISSVYCYIFNFDIHEYSKSMLDATSYAIEKSEKIDVVNNDFLYNNEQQSVYLRYYFYEKTDDMVDLKTDLETRGAVSGRFKNVDRNINFFNDGTIRYVDEISHDVCYIIEDEMLEKLSFNEKEYQIKEFGCYNVLIKKNN